MDLPPAAGTFRAPFNFLNQRFFLKRAEIFFLDRLSWAKEEVEDDAEERKRKRNQAR